MKTAEFACFSTRCRIRASQAAIDACLSLCARLAARWNFYDPASTLSEFNARAERDEAASMLLDDEEFRALTALQNAPRSGFDPAIGSAKFASGKAHHQIIQPLAKKRRWWVQDGRLHAECALDFGGVMKEAAVDLCALICERVGGAAGEYVVNFGGDLRCAKSLRVYIKDPQNPSMPAAIVSLPAGSSLCTSALYERGAHIINPREQFRYKREFSENSGVLEKLVDNDDGAGGSSADGGGGGGAWVQYSSDVLSATVCYMPSNQAAREDFATMHCGVLSTRMMFESVRLGEHFAALLIDKNKTFRHFQALDFHIC